MGGSFAALGLALAGFTWVLVSVPGRMGWPLAWWATVPPIPLSLPVSYWVVSDTDVEPNLPVILTVLLAAVALSALGALWTYAVWARWRWPLHLASTIVPSVLLLIVAAIIAERGEPYYARAEPGVHFAAAVNTPDFAAIPAMLLPIILGVVTAVMARRAARPDLSQQ